MVNIQIQSGIATLTATGPLIGADIQAALAEYLKHPDRIVGMPAIWDLRTADMESLTTEDVRELVGQFSVHIHELAKHVAIIVDNPLQYGMARAWQQWAESKAHQNRRIFPTPEQAHQWLASVES